MRHASGVKFAALALTLLALLGFAGCSSQKSPTFHITSGIPTNAPVTGIVQGRLLAVGGPAPGKPRPIAGTVLFDGPDGSRAQTEVDATGRFAIGLAPGTYTLSGTSPSYGSGKSICRTLEAHVVLTSNGTTTANIYCQEP
ncbi:MAG: Carboxypeptidase regulatory-like domain [Marmoricola sp.]|nr:Carboxypeptidase regulatory-like domain [Marmoricola sp.]